MASPVGEGMVVGCLAAPFFAVDSEQGDVVVFATLEELAGFHEPPEVLSETILCFDANGSRLSLRLDGDRTTVAAAGEATATDRSLLAGYLVAFLRRLGQPPQVQPVDWQSFVRECAARITQWQGKRHRWVWR